MYLLVSLTTECLSGRKWLLYTMAFWPWPSRSYRTQLLTFDAEIKSTKNPNSVYGGVGVGNNFQILMLSPNLLKTQIPYMVVVVGGGGLGPNFQLLMPSPNLLKTQIPHMVVMRGGAGEQHPTFDVESKTAKNTNSLYSRGGGGELGPNFQLLMPSPNLLKTQIPYTVRVGGGEGGLEPKFQLLMWSQNLLKTQIPCWSGRWGGGWWAGIQLPTLDTDSKSAKNPNSLFGLGGGGGELEPNFQLLMASPNLLKTQIPYIVVGGGLGNNFQLLMPSPNLLNSKFPIWWGGVGGLWPNFQILMLSPNLLTTQIPYMVKRGGELGPNFQILMLSPNLLKTKFLIQLGWGD